MTPTFIPPRPCDHEGHCEPALCPSDCGIVQLAQSLKYSVNHTWQFAELSPGIFALYNPVHRELIAIGKLEEIISAYRSRKSFVPPVRAAPQRLVSRFQNVKVNI